MRRTVGLPLVLGVVLVAPRILAPAAATAQAPPVRDVRLSADSVEIGDRFDLRFTVELPAGAVAFFPDSLTGEAFEPFEAVGWTAEPTASGGFELDVTYPLMAFGTGSIAVPELEVFLVPAEEAQRAGFARPGDRVGSWEAFRASPASTPSARLASVPEQRLQVATVLALDDITTQITPRPAAGVSGGDRHWPATILLVAFGLLLVGVVGLSARDWASAAIATPHPTPPSERERALAALDELLAAGLHREGRTRDFYAAWSEIVRRYVEGFVDDWGPSWTSTELMADLSGRRRSAAIERSLVAEAVVDEMRTAETVKFGGRRPDPETAEEHWRAVRAWIAGSTGEGGGGP